MLKYIVDEKIWSLSLIVLDIKGLFQLAQGAVPVSSIILQCDAMSLMWMERYCALVLLKSVMSMALILEDFRTRV